MIITIGGSVGSGKTTLAKEISKRFDLRHISAGEVMRQMAKDKGISLLEFSKLAEKDTEIDEEIDRRQKEMASSDCVVDGRLSAYFMESDLAIWLDAPLEVRAQRVAKREGVSKKTAKEGIIKREKSERKRYKEIYGIDLADKEIYDLVVNTKRLGIDDMTDLICAAIKVFNLS